VRIFFVISGYLITSLLLRERERFGQVSLRLFYARRALRILPAFLVFVACVVVLERLGLLTLPPHNLIWVLTYTVNFAPHGTWWTGHLWSLSVEEQFYLLWPLALRLLSVRICALVASVAVVSGILLRALNDVAHIQLVDPALKFAFPFVCGSLAIGCLLALAEPAVKHALLAAPSVTRTAALLAIPVVVVLDAADLGSLNRFLTLAGDALIGFLVARFVYLPDDILGRFLNSPVMVFIGKLSYSLYLWQQLFFQRFTTWWVAAFPWNVIATFTLASTSYFMLERPLMNLRGRLRRTALVPVGAGAR
jgi:peptidoglycan/LPS O-acetylase OafA/YrhL